MKALQLFALVLALGVAPAFAQQEVDPDHFDQPAAKAPVVQKAQASQLKAQHAHKRNHESLASNHAGHVHHHHARTAA